MPCCRTVYDVLGVLRVFLLVQVSASVFLSMAVCDCGYMS